MNPPDNLPPLPPVPKCHCRDCNPSAWWMICCSQCGNKRCPHALHHLNECTNSNASGQHIEHAPRPMTLRDTALGVKIVPPTSVEARACEDIAARQRLGIAKHGVTVECSPDDMLRHAYEKALDLAVYLNAELERRTGHE